MMELNNEKSINYNFVRSEMLQFIPSTTKRMLDVGCSFGKFSALVKSKISTEIWGIEIDPEAAKEAKAKLDKVIIGDICQIIEDLPIGYFDCIVFNDVLEHLVDPWDILQNINKNLNTNGVIVASIPNFLEFNNIYSLLKTADWRYKEFGILDNTHLRFFTKKSIIRMFDDCGYSLIQIKGINSSRGRKWKLLNTLSLGKINDSQFLQFACVAKKKDQI